MVDSSSYFSVQRRTGRLDSLGPDSRRRLRAVGPVRSRSLQLRHVRRFQRPDQVRLLSGAVRLDAGLVVARRVLVHPLVVTVAACRGRSTVAAHRRPVRPNHVLAAGHGPRQRSQ